MIRASDALNPQNQGPPGPFWHLAKGERAAPQGSGAGRHLEGARFANNPRRINPNSLISAPRAEQIPQLYPKQILKSRSIPLMY
eukprot:6205183-Pleurochrysis_carterae.AAC.1